MLLVFRLEYLSILYKYVLYAKFSTLHSEILYQLETSVMLYSKRYAKHKVLTHTHTTVWTVQWL